MVRRRPSSFSTTLSLILTLAASGCGSQFDNETPDPPDGTEPVGLQLVASGLSFPLYLTAPEGDARLFVVEKGGTIRIVKDGSLLPIPFLDISSQVSTGREQGLLGLAFHPQYPTNGRFVVHYTDPAGDTRVSGFRVSPDPDVADAASEVAILAEDQPFSNHNGGQVLFGPDGYLYIMLGDGGSADDPGGRGQSLADLLGSILRVEPLEGGGYAVPADNPFVSTAGARPEIWSYGLRNPWRIAFDAATGDLYIADVGQSRWEEVDVSPSADGAGRGLNFGWSVMEGPDCFLPSNCDTLGKNLRAPIAHYDHGVGSAVISGAVYRGTRLPELQGLFVYGDFRGGLWSVYYDGVNPPIVSDLVPNAPNIIAIGIGNPTKSDMYFSLLNGSIMRLARVVATDAETPAAAGSRLLGNFPNPFNPSTTIRYRMHVAGSVQVDIVTVGGERVRRLDDGRREAGAHAIPWRGETDTGGRAASGVYFYRLIVDGTVVDAARMVLVQ